MGRTHPLQSISICCFNNPEKVQKNSPMYWIPFIIYLFCFLLLRFIAHTIVVITSEITIMIMINPPIEPPIIVVLDHDKEPAADAVFVCPLISSITNKIYKL